MGLPGHLPYVVIDQLEVGSGGAGSVTFVGIDKKAGALPFTPRHLLILVSAQKTTTGGSALYWNLNGDATSTNYHRQRLYGIGSTPNANSGDDEYIGVLSGSDQNWSGTEILVPHFQNSDNHKIGVSLAGASENWVQITVSRWGNTAAITSIKLFPSLDSFAQGSRFILAVVDERYAIDEVNLESLALTGAVADDGGAQTDETTAANESTADDMTLLPATPAVNDAYYFGHSDRFNRLVLDISTSGVGTWSLQWEYWDGSAWTPLSNVTDGTSGFTAAVGEHSVTWDRPSDWAVTSVSGISGYWVRARVSAYSSVTTQPLGQQAWIVEKHPVEFTGIPQVDGDLMVVGYARTDRAATTDNLYHAINGDTTDANYARQWLRGTGASEGAGSSTDRILAVSVGNTATGNVFGASYIYYPAFSDAQDKIASIITGMHESSGPSSFIEVVSNRYNNTAPIKQLSYSPRLGTNFIRDSLFSLYMVPKRTIKRVEVGAGGQASVTFDSIPQFFEAIRVTAYARADRASVHEWIAMEINDDATSADYNRQDLRRQSDDTVSTFQNASSNAFMICTGDNAAAGIFGADSFLLPAYSKTDRHKHGLQNGGRGQSGATGPELQSLRWEAPSNEAITKIKLTPNNSDRFLEGSVFILEGILPRGGPPPSSGLRIG